MQGGLSWKTGHFGHASVRFGALKQGGIEMTTVTYLSGS